MTTARSTRRRASLPVAVAITAVLVAACGSGSKAAPVVDEGAAAASVPGSSFPKTVTHDMGTTQIPQQPKRIIALDNSLVEAVVLLDRPLVGGISSYRDQTGFPPYLGDAVKDTKDVGPLETPDLEAIAALEPDLIVSATVRHEALYDELSKIAPVVFVKTTGPQWQENITFLGSVLGAEDKAAAELAAFKARAKTVGDAINAKAGNPTISVVRFLDGPTRLMQRKSFIGGILNDAGLARPESQSVDGFAADIGEESIRQADADYVFVSSFSGGQPSKERFLRNPLWKELTAVKAGRVTDVADEVWMTSVSVQGARLVLDDLAKTFQVEAAAS